MSDVQENLEDQKLKIITQIAELSRLLGMNPSDGSIDVYEPMTQNRMALSNWLSTTRDSFLNLSLSIGKALDIQLQ
jgi:DNA-binding transcriptional regulator GbsR (MarR family)